MPPRWPDLDSRRCLLKCVVQEIRPLGRNRKWFPGSALTSEPLGKPGQGWGHRFLCGLPFGRKSWWNLGGLGATSSLAKGPACRGEMLAFQGGKIPLPGVSYRLMQELLMQQSGSHLPFPRWGLCPCLAGEYHGSACPSQALLAVKSPGISRPKRRMYSVSPTDVKIHVKPRVKIKKRKQSSWTARIRKPLSLPYAWSYIWQRQFWRGEGTRRVSPFVL